MKNLFIYLIFIIAVVALGAVIGIYNVPDAWYQSLNKASFNPPNWVFAPVWTILYIVIGFVGARTWIKDGLSLRMIVWIDQMILNYIWSPTFFSVKIPEVALVIVIMMLISIFGFMYLSRERDKLSMFLFIPYAAWVSFATVLTASVVYLN